MHIGRERARVCASVCLCVCVCVCLCVRNWFNTPAVTAYRIDIKSEVRAEAKETVDFRLSSLLETFKAEETVEH